MIAADREHRNGQLAFLGKELLVIDGVVSEGCELAAEGIVNGMRAGVEGGVVIARLFVDPGRVNR